MHIRAWFGGGERHSLKVVMLPSRRLVGIQRCPSPRKRATRTRVLVLCALLVFLSAAFCEGEVVKIRQIEKSGPNRYYIVFSSRPIDPLHGSLAGHAFVAWGIENSDGQYSWQTAYGYYPAKGHGILATVPGKLVEEDIVQSVDRADQTLIVEVSKETFESSSTMRKDWADHDPGYKLAYTDCVDFTDKMARAIGLSVPQVRSEAIFPQAYVHQLIDLNQPKTPLFDLLPPSLRPSPSPFPAVPSGQNSPGAPAQKGNSLSTGLKQLQYASPIALQRLYMALRFAQEHPETHIDIVLNIEDRSLTDVDIFATQMRGDSVLKEGDSACIYVRVPTSSTEKLNTAAILSDVNRLLSLRYSDPPTLAGGLGVNAGHPLFTSASQWLTAPTSRPVCYIWLTGSESVNVLPEIGQVRYLSPVIKVSKARYPKDDSVFNPNSPLQVSDPHPSRELTRLEQLWREYRNEVATLQNVASIRNDAYSGLSNSEISKRKSFQQQSKQDMSVANDYEQSEAHDEKDWQSTQENRFAVMRSKALDRQTAIKQRVEQIRSQNVAKYPPMAWPGYPDSLMEANRQAMVNAIGKTRGLAKSNDLGGAIATAGAGGGASGGSGGGSLGGSGNGNTGGTGNGPGPVSGSGGAGAGQVEVPVVGPTGSCNADVEMCVWLVPTGGKK